MKLSSRRFIGPALLVTALAASLGSPCYAQLVSPGDFRGKSHSQWALDWMATSVANGLGGASLPETVDGVHFLPPNFGGGDFVANLTIREGTPLLVVPYMVFGELYDDGTSDDVTVPEVLAFVENVLFGETTIRATYDGTVVLEGLANVFPDRSTGISYFSPPIAFATPILRDAMTNKHAIAASWGKGIATIYDMLPLGQHTIKNEVDSSFFGRSSYTYNINVRPVPEPSSLACLTVCIAGLSGRRARLVR